MFSSGHRNGIFVLILLIIILQLVILNFNTISDNLFAENEKSTLVDNKWLGYQKYIDSLNSAKSEEKQKIFPFNPNYITDYKGYMLGMSVEEIDRLHTFRENGKFVNSAKEFQNITKVSDSLLNVISPYFKFPDWVVKKNNTKRQNHQFFEKKKIELKDINLATKEDLMAVYGIGDKLSDIILRDKEKFGAFASIEQLQFIWGITPERYEAIKKHFFITAEPENLKKIKINEASTKELYNFPYFNYAFAKEIVTYRSMNGEIKSVDDLSKIKDCPKEKLKIIALYLDIK